MYAPGANGNSVPLRTIYGPSTGLDGPNGVALDAADTLYVANTRPIYVANTRLPGGSITVYAPGTGGNAAPLAPSATRTPDSTNGDRLQGLQIKGWS